MHPCTPPFRSPLFYSVQNEDYRTELAVLDRLGTGLLRVLMIASSGENVLSVLTRGAVADLSAVDINPAQLALCELRRTAAGHLTRDQQLELFGTDPAKAGASGAAQRIALYEKVLPHLPDAARTFWDERRDQDIAFGVHHVGRNDVSSHDIQERLRAAGFEPLRVPLSAHDEAAWVAAYEQLLTPAYIRDLFGLPSEALAARIAAIAGRLGACHFRALRQPYPERNPFVTTVFVNSYASAAGEDGLPLYLQIQGQEALRRFGLGRLRLVAGNALDQTEALAREHGRFDLISISNIADWMSAAEFEAAVRRTRECLTPGGALLARTATGQPMIADVMHAEMRADRSFDAALAATERGPWFRVVTAGFRPE